jgi:hypothetical protein
VGPVRQRAGPGTRKSTCGSAQSTSCPPPVPFDKILAVNSILFWRDPVTRLAELHQLLRPGGVIAVAHQPRGPGASAETSAAKGRQMAASLDEARFSEVRFETLGLKPAVVSALGVNGGAT